MTKLNKAHKGKCRFWQGSQAGSVHVEFSIMHKTMGVKCINCDLYFIGQNFKRPNCDGI